MGQPATGEQQLKYVFLDTSVLLAAGEGRPVLHWITEQRPHLEHATTQGAVKELQTLSEQRRGKRAAAARLAARLAEEQDLYIVQESNNHVDDALLAAAKRHEGCIATLDKELRRRARKQGIPVLTFSARGRVIDEKD